MAAWVVRSKGTRKAPSSPPPTPGAWEHLLHPKTLVPDIPPLDNLLWARELFCSQKFLLKTHPR